MTNYKIDPAWAKAQLDDAGYSSRNQDAVDLREAVMLLVPQFNAAEGNVQLKMQALEIFSKLANGSELVGRDVQSPGARWSDFQLGGDVRPGATVRVRLDAYDGDAGDRHNGMVGHFVAARGGQAIVQYANSTEGTGHRHEPSRLEVLTVPE